LVSYSALLFIKKLTIVSIFVSKVLSHPKFLREGISVGSGRRISIARMSDREIGMGCRLTRICTYLHCRFFYDVKKCKTCVMARLIT
jgi:hypothetical protein